MATYLYHAKSGDFYLHTAALAKRTDMQLVEAGSLDEAKAKVNRIHATAEELANDAPAEAAKPAAKKKAAEPAAKKKADEPAAANLPEEPAIKAADLFDDE